MLTTRLLGAGRRALFAARNYSKHGEKFVEPHMNELPVPTGSWAEAHAAKQKKYNAVLGAGIIIFAGTVTFITQSGVIFFNFYPPDSIE